MNIWNSLACHFHLILKNEQILHIFMVMIYEFLYIEMNVMLSYNILIMLCIFYFVKVVSHNSYRMVPLLITRLVYICCSYC